MEKIIDKIIGKMTEKVISLMINHILKSSEDFQNANLWEKAIEKACRATEGIDISFANYLKKSPAMQRYFMWLTSTKLSEDIYRKFILTIAIELCAFNSKKEFAVSIGMAIIDNWFELKKIDCQEIRNQMEADIIVNDREQLYREYFSLFNDPLSKDIIRVYYPKNGQSWVSNNKDYSIDIKVNLSRGTEYGFCRVGFSYSRILENGDEIFLKIAYVDDTREIFRFEYNDLIGIDGKNIIWAQ